MFQDDRETRDERAQEARAAQQFTDLRVGRVDPPSKIPQFEGQVVHATKLKLAGASGLDIADEVLKIDDIRTFSVLGRVTRIDHVVNETTGQMHRVHTIKVLDAELLPTEGVAVP